MSLIMAGQSRAVLNHRSQGAEGNSTPPKGYDWVESPRAHHARTRISQLLLRSNQVTVKINQPITLSEFVNSPSIVCK